MPIGPGSRVGPYEITALLGEGGMGKVWRAQHTGLKRDDALKVLPDAFASDPDRLARFQREAQVLASLNHPNIAHVYGLERSDGVQALVMELVEGPTLADRIAQGAIPIDEALPIAKQICEALEAAHEQGIIHRDLKPANIKVRPDGTVKVLDFGLAKVATSSGAESQAPTATMGGTREGVILGTAAYMSPEQARGTAVDKRTDIWALGCVLYEMLTGRAVFARSTLSDTLASILEREPEWRAVPITTPPTIRRLLQRCLEKDTKRRLHDIADARIEIEDALTSPLAWGLPPAADHGVSQPASRIRTWQTVAFGLGTLALVGGGLTVWNLTGPAVVSSNRGTMKFGIHLHPGDQFPVDTGLPVVLAIAPDGGRFVYAARNANGDRLYLRDLGDVEAAPIPGTEGAIGPFFSPDGQWIGFASGGMLRAVPVAGGAARAIAEAPNLTGASWAPTDTIVYSNWNSGLFKVSAHGGRPESLTALDTGQGEIEHTASHALPDGAAVLFTVRRPGGQFIEAVQIATRRRLPLVEGRNPVYLPSGNLVFARGDALFAVPFDATRLEVTGSAVRLLDGVRIDGNDTHFAVAGDGTLISIPELSRESSLVWVNRQGNSRPLDNQRRRYSHPRISPDGLRVVLTLPRESGGNEIWIYDAARGLRARLSPSGSVSRPIWEAGGRQITFQSDGSLFTVAADDSGEPQLVLSREDRFAALFPLDWSKDGRVLMFSAPTAATNRDVWTRPMDGTITPFLVTPRDERAAMFSPDGRWVVYAARETGREEQVYVQPYPGPGGRVVISPGGGIEPIWSPTGRDIFYRSIDGTRMMSVDVRAEPSLVVGTPRVLFAGQFLMSDGSYWSNYDVSRDGQEFLMLEADQTSTPQVDVILNWQEELKRLVPTN